MKYTCEVAYKFYYITPEEKELTCFKYFTSEQGDWLECHENAYEFARNLRKQGNKVHRLELVHTGSTLIKS
jgi:hypothetical protein